MRIRRVEKTFFPFFRLLRFASNKKAKNIGSVFAAARSPTGDLGQMACER